jgi:small GTP-binding protein
VCGPRTRELCIRHLRFASIRPLDVRRAALLDEAGEALDEILVVATGQNALVLHLHGNPVLVRRCAMLLDRFGFASAGAPVAPFCGADPLDREAAELAPAMLTCRGLAWLAAQPARLRAAAADIAALADADEAARRVEAIIARRRLVEWFTRPLRVAVVGPPNVGKSTLINALTDHPISITAPTPGTTRDFVEALDEVEGFPVAWLDTAGLRAPSDDLERAGIERSREVVRDADTVLLVLEARLGDLETSIAQAVDSLGRKPDCVAFNKCDILGEPGGRARSFAERSAAIVFTSAIQRRGMAALASAVLDSAGRDRDELDAPAAFTDRQTGWLGRFARRP